VLSQDVRIKMKRLTYQTDFKKVYYIKWKKILQKR